MMIDLTETFGAGNEPSAEVMEYFISSYENYHFTGTVDNLITYKALAQMAADSAMAISAAGLSVNEKYFSITSDREFEILVQLHDVTYARYVYKKGTADDFVRLNTTSICTFDGTTPTDIIVVHAASVQEFAVSFKPNGTSLDYLWFPQHTSGTAFAESQNLYFDDVEIVSATPTAFVPFNEFRLEQVVDAIHPDDGTSTHLLRVQIVTSIDKNSDRIMMAGCMTTLADTDIGQSYLGMFPVKTDYCNRIRTNFGSVYPTVKTDGSDTDLVFEGDYLTSVAAENTGIYSRYRFCMELALPEATTRRGEAGRRDPVCFIEHRDASLQKLYIATLPSTTLTTGESFRFGCALYMEDTGK